ncbi:RHS repeat domain-containing protein [unidentified bacterial endosymbiont]|uniref:RHS repeat domain-containing protein n=1 Tax=unidentified bacterial endosymbiont TaxID=2355 RepID=UPI00344B9CCA
MYIRWGLWFYGWCGNFKTAQGNEEVTWGGSDRVLSRTTFIYDTLCRLVEAKNDDATVTYEYDDASRVTVETINGRRAEYCIKEFWGFVLRQQMQPADCHG